MTSNDRKNAKYNCVHDLGVACDTSRYMPIQMDTYTYIQIQIHTGQYIKRQIYMHIYKHMNSHDKPYKHIQALYRQNKSNIQAPFRCTKSYM